MSKKIHQKYWSFRDEIELPPVEKKRSFLWFSWVSTIIPTKYKYENVQDLVDEVNAFVNDNNIDNIISYINTSEHIVFIDYEDERPGRRGGIELTWISEDEPETKKGVGNIVEVEIIPGNHNW